MGDREKIVTGVKKFNFPLLSGYQIYHNYIRPHQGLDGRTPSEAAGVEVKGQDRWLTLIQNARNLGESIKGNTRNVKFTVDRIYCEIPVDRAPSTLGRLTVSGFRRMDKTVT